MGLERIVIQKEGISQLIEALQSEGYRVVGPTVRDEAILYDELRSVSDLPVGITDEQAGGHYRLKARSDGALFGYNVGPHSWKKFPFPSSRRLWKADGGKDSLRFVEEPPPSTRYAFFGVRACELHALAIQDKVFLGSGNTDSHYRAIRSEAFIVAVNCTQAGNTCFCASMGTGPRCSPGFDLCLTELIGNGQHEFLVEVGTSIGKKLSKNLASRPAQPQDQDRMERVCEATRDQMGRRLNNEGIKDMLYRQYESPRWEEVAKRCLNCANCTMACPTCFCSTVEDTSDLKGEHAERWRHWDSCFNLDFSYVHGGNVRASASSRYRQWMTHKLATWYDQFGTSGCVGCGRCITWCPVGIDITEEAAALRLSDEKAGKEVS